MKFAVIGLLMLWGTACYGIPGLLPSEIAIQGVSTSFVYDGRSSDVLLPQWTRVNSEPRAVSGGIHYSYTWAAPDGFIAQLDVVKFELPPATEFRWTFTNTSANPGGLITDAHAIEIRAPSEPGQIVVRSSRGGIREGLEAAPNHAGFELTDTQLGELRLSVKGGRSSNGHLPFFSLGGLANDRGLAIGLGWSGQWVAHGFYHEDSGETRLHAGMTPVHFRLPPGESVRMPSVLIVPFKGDQQVGANLMRRALRSHYQGRLDGEPVLAPVSFSSWFVFRNEIEAKMLTEIASAMAPLGVEYFCIDAGWFEGGFPHGVGNWTVDKEKFPDGLKPVADHVRSLGMKFGLWFEPERASEGTRWYEEHRDLFFDGPPFAEHRYLMDLGKPEAQTLIVETISQYVTEVGIDWIRYDFNIGPFGFWNAAESENERGLAQLRYHNGLYSVLAQLMERHPNLLIEQCSSGGLRIDLEMVRYGHTFWKSDETRDLSVMRFHQSGGNTFLPGSMLNTNYCEAVSEGDIISLFAGSLGFGLDFRELTFAEREFLEKAITAYKEVRRFLDCDYFPLLPQNRSEKQWKGWVFIDPDTQEGVVTAYRPEKAVENSRQVDLSEYLGRGEIIAENVLNGEIVPVSKSKLPLNLAPSEGGVWRFTLE